jgi:transposase, IS6 family
MKTGYATIKGFEVMRMIRRRHCILIEPMVTGEVSFVATLFGVSTGFKTSQPSFAAASV